MGSRKTMKLATRGKRFASACIDMAIPFVVYIILISVIGARTARFMSPGYGYGFDDDFMDPFGYGFGYGYGYGYNEPFFGRGTAFLICALLLVLLAYIIVEFVFFAKGRSIGKMMLGLQVVSSADGSPFGFWRMLLRECIVKQASAVLMLGYIWILIDDKNRGWHDKILDSYVVDLKESEMMHRAEPQAYREAAPYGAEPVYEEASDAEYAPSEQAPAEAFSAPAEAEALTEEAPAAAPAANVISEMPKRPVIRLDE